MRTVEDAGPYKCTICRLCCFVRDVEDAVPYNARNQVKIEICRGDVLAVA